MKKVFISYRRLDSGELANEIATVIRRSFGYSSTFIDTGDISAGSHWSEVLEQHLESMVALICVIGPNWIGLTDNQSRIDDAEDWVRREISYAIQRKIPILPFLTENANLPSEDELPTELHPMLKVQALKAAHVYSSYPTMINWLANYLIPPIRFKELFLIDKNSLADPCLTFWDRLGHASKIMHPKSIDELLNRDESDKDACLVRQPVVWHQELITNINRPEIPDHVREKTIRFLHKVEQRVTYTCVGLARYSGPPQPDTGTTIHAVLHLLYFACLRVQNTLHHYIKDNSITRLPLKNLHRWQFDIDYFFSTKEEISIAYVTKVSGLSKIHQTEMCIYGPRSIIEQSYRNSGFGLLNEVSSSWYGHYFIPQLELMLAEYEFDDLVHYDGRLAIRKIVDLKGEDLKIRY